MDSTSRRDATIFIWSISMMIALFLLFASGREGVMLIPLGMALLGTAIIWGSAIIEAMVTPKYYPPSQAKREDTTAYKLAMLMELMDEDERQAFKNRLADDLLSGDDSLSIESLITEKRKRG
ncbi:MAG: hypothetical protein SFZ02_03845 [bacterium]|nr:hypothetical protein [bacterium]